MFSGIAILQIAVAHRGTSCVTRALELSKILSCNRSKISWNCQVEMSVPLMRFTSETRWGNVMLPCRQSDP